MDKLCLLLIFSLWLPRLVKDIPDLRLISGIHPSGFEFISVSGTSITYSEFEMEAREHLFSSRGNCLNAPRKERKAPDWFPSSKSIAFLMSSETEIKSSFLWLMPTSGVSVDTYALEKEHRHESQAYLSCTPLELQEKSPDSLMIVFWNLENFFDYKDGGLSDADNEFSEKGLRGWSKKRFFTKCRAVAKALSMVDSRKLPEMVGVAEVENEYVVRSIISSTLLQKFGYRAVHFDGPDPRGIDCALLYRKNVFSSVKAFPARVRSDRPTRDILVAQCVTAAGDSLLVFVNHHPSKYGGGESEGRRAAAVLRLRELSDSLLLCGWRHQVAIGDFNDLPSSRVYDILRPSLTCLSSAVQARGEGSIRFNGTWELIDQIWVSSSIAPRARTAVVRLPALLTRDSSHAGEKPLRTYSGPRYLGGVSDHLPIVLYLRPGRGVAKSDVKSATIFPSSYILDFEEGLLE